MPAVESLTVQAYDMTNLVFLTLTWIGNTIVRISRLKKTTVAARRTLWFNSVFCFVFAGPLMSADLPCHQAKYPVFFHPSAVKKKFRNEITLWNRMQPFLLNVFVASRSQCTIPQMVATFHPKLTSLCFGYTWLYLSFVQLTKGSVPGYACNKSQCCQIQPLKTISSDITKINSFFSLSQ